MRALNSGQVAELQTWLTPADERLPAKVIINNPFAPFPCSSFDDSDDDPWDYDWMLERRLIVQVNETEDEIYWSPTYIAALALRIAKAQTLVADLLKACG